MGIPVAAVEARGARGGDSVKVAVLGAGGQLGSDVCRAFEAAGHGVAALGRPDADITDAKAVRRALEAAAPDVVVNAAGRTDVDGCEGDPVGAFAVNAVGARNVAVAARELGFALVHLSTDYVFDGTKGAPYVEEDCPSPLNVYGVTKLAGEHFVRSVAPRHLIVRTSGLYGARPAVGKGGLNFVVLMLKLARERGEVRVVADQRVSPTYTMDLARQLVGVVEAGVEGVVHATSAGECTWYEFAAKIFELAGVPVRLEPTTTAELGRAARRPAYSVLDNARLRALGLDVMPPWEDGLRRFLEAVGERAPSG